MSDLFVVPAGTPQPKAELPRTAQVLRFNGITRHDLPVEAVLDEARHLKVAIVIGYTDDGEEYFASTVADGADVVWLLERTRLRLIAGDYEAGE